MSFFNWKTNIYICKFLVVFEALQRKKKDWFHLCILCFIILYFDNFVDDEIIFFLYIFFII